MSNMKRAALDGVELEYDIRGSGEPIVMVHHGAGADWFDPLCEQPSLNARYRLVRYHRAGYAGSSRLVPPLTFAQEARNFRALMRHLGIERAHVVGHSASGCIALQIALDASDIVHSLALLEPALMAVPSPPEVPRALELYRAGDTIALSILFFEERAARSTVRSWQRQFPVPPSRRWPTPLPFLNTNCRPCGSGPSGQTMRAMSGSRSLRW